MGRSNNESEQAQLDTELKALLSLRKYSHRHIIDLLGSVQKGDGIGLIFPLATSDLDSLMSLEDHTQDPAYASWLLEQFRGLVSAVSLLHTSSMYHHDIKPSNILLMGNSLIERRASQSNRDLRLVLADFGLSHFKPKSTKSEYKWATKLGKTSTPEWSLGTDQILADRRYIPPETEMGRKLSASCDIWSLGCVVLEALVWIAYGVNARKELLKEINASSTGDRDPFWMVLESSEIVLRPTVIRWINRLEKSLGGGHILFPALQLVRSGMLLPDPEQRLPAADLLERLKSPHANPSAQQNSSKEGTRLSNAQNSPRAPNVQANLQDDLIHSKRKGSDKTSQPNSATANIALPLESMESATTEVASSADGIPKNCPRPDNTVDGSHLKSRASANANAIQSSAQKRRLSLHQDQDFTMEHGITDVENPQRDDEGSHVLELAKDLQKLHTEERYSVSGPTTTVTNAVEGSSMSNEVQGEVNTSSQTPPKSTPLDRQSVLASIVNRFADGIQATSQKQPDEDTPVSFASNTETVSAVNGPQPSVPSNEQESPDLQRSRSRSPRRRSFQKCANKDDRCKVLKRRKRSRSESGLKSGEGVVKMAKFSSATEETSKKSTSFTGAPPRMRSGGVTYFRSGDFASDQRLLNTH